MRERAGAPCSPLGIPGPIDAYPHDAKAMDVQKRRCTKRNALRPVLRVARRLQSPSPALLGLFFALVASFLLSLHPTISLYSPSYSLSVLPSANRLVTARHASLFIPACVFRREGPGRGGWGA